MTFRAPPTSEAEKRQKQIEERLEKYIQGISGGSKKFNRPLSKDSQKYLNCLQSRVSARDFGSLKDLTNFCPGNMFSDHELIKKLGFQTPEEFNRAMALQAKELQSKIDQFGQEDVVVVVKDHLQLYETKPRGLDISAVDNQIVSLSKDVESIVVKLHQSASFENFARDMEAKGFNSGKEELLELSQLLSTLDGTESSCLLLEDKEEEHPEKRLLRYLEGIKKDGGDDGKIFLGVSSEEDLAKLKSYRFHDGDTFYYLYKSNTEASNEERWVLAKLEKDGKASFRYYQIFSNQGNGEIMAQDKDMKVITPGNHHTVVQTGENGKIYFQAQEGLVVKRKNVSAPVIGNSMLPNGDLVISRVNMTYVGSDSFHQNNLSLTQDGVSLETVTSSKNASTWAASGGLKYYPLDNRWRVMSNVRVYNFLLGYTDNLSGIKDARATYMFDNNFVSVDSNLNNQFRASAGREFMKGRGAATFTTDFKKTAEIKVIFIVQ